MPTILSRWAVVALTGLAAAAGDACAQTPSFTLIPAAPGTLSTQAYGLSADGAVTAGFSVLSNDVAPGFRWSSDAGRTDFGLQPGVPPVTLGRGISGDGSTVVGYGWTVSGQNPDTRAFRWRASAGGGGGTYQSLGLLGTYPRTYGLGVSGDGEIVVGRSGGFSSESGQAFRWTEAGGMQGLGFTRPGHFYSEASAISRDGRVVVGYSYGSSGLSDAFTWTASSGMTMLPSLVGSDGSAYAYGVNATGSVVVGMVGFLGEAALWRNGQVTNMGRPVGYGGAQALAVSDDGGVIAGVASGGGHPNAAFVWTPATGIQFLSDYLTGNGVSIPNGWVLRECNGISADGTSFSGIAALPGQSTLGFVARIPSPASLPLGLMVALAMNRRRR